MSVYTHTRTSLGAQMVKSLLAMQRSGSINSWVKNITWRRNGYPL